MNIEFDPGIYTVTWNGRATPLLPKEYQLLTYMFQHQGRTFTRDQLLDAVWPLEAPTDRTVDDHVYRIRKKLAHLEPSLAIETIRGAGYRLNVKRPEPKSAAPLPQAFAVEMQNISNTYIRYGRGDALLTLARNQDTLGFEINPPTRHLIRLMEGDLRFLVDEQMPFAERAFTLLLLNHYLEPIPNRPFVEAALRSGILPAHWHWELEWILKVIMLMDWGQLDEAKRLLDELSAEVKRNAWEGLVPITANFYVEYALHDRNPELLASCIHQAEAKLQQYPYQREKGQLFVLQGIARYAADRRGGLRLIEEGLSLLKQSQFLLNLMNGLHRVLYFSRRDEWGKDRESFVKEWDRLLDQTGIAEIRTRIHNQLNKNLGAL